MEDMMDDWTRAQKREKDMKAQIEEQKTLIENNNKMLIEYEEQVKRLGNEINETKKRMDEMKRSYDEKLKDAEITLKTNKSAVEELNRFKREVVEENADQLKKWEELLRTRQIFMYLNTIEEKANLRAHKNIILKPDSKYQNSIQPLYKEAMKLWVDKAKSLNISNPEADYHDPVMVIKALTELIRLYNEPELGTIQMSDDIIDMVATCIKKIKNMTVYNPTKAVLKSGNYKDYYNDDPRNTYKVIWGLIRCILYIGTVRDRNLINVSRRRALYSIMAEVWYRICLNKNSVDEKIIAYDLFKRLHDFCDSIELNYLTDIYEEISNPNHVYFKDFIGNNFSHQQSSDSSEQQSRGWLSSFFKSWW